MLLERSASVSINPWTFCPDSIHSVHADVAVPGRDRVRRERLLRYVARPPLCEDRLDGMDDGRLVYVFKRPWRDGTDRLIFEPEDLSKTGLTRNSSLKTHNAKGCACRIFRQPGDIKGAALG